ncbi:Sec-independent protein translocase protein TatB [Frigidibacter sp.]|uniref:Sec-independent protein translocase protein TatB n=1 Tax=Frigidibacter sp. TaxID=2586418 RepID=UPI0035263BCB
MFDIGWSELLVIGVVALIVVGPKDLPVMFRTLGRMTGKARGMAREFSRAMDDAARESGVKDIGNDLKAATSKKALGLDALEKAADRFEKWDPKRPMAQTQAKPAADLTPPKPMGPATQALADDRAAAAAARSAAPVDPPVALPDPAAPTPAPPTSATPVKRIAKTRSRPTPSGTPAEAPAAKAEKPAKPAKPKATADAGAPKRTKRAKTDKGDA